MNEENTKDLHNQDDVKPGSELEKLVNDEHDGHAPVTKGTGANNAVPREDSLIIKDEDVEDEPND